MALCPCVSASRKNTRFISLFLYILSQRGAKHAPNITPRVCEENHHLYKNRTWVKLGHSGKMPIFNTFWLRWPLKSVFPAPQRSNQIVYNYQSEGLSWENHFRNKFTLNNSILRDYFLSSSVAWCCSDINPSNATLVLQIHKVYSKHLYSVTEHWMNCR